MIMASPKKKTPLEEFKDDLLAMEPAEFAMTRIFDAVPVLFKEASEWTAWKLRLGASLNVDAHSIVFIGSSCLGFSLNPYKNFRSFGPDSDIDIAIVSSYHFEVGWRFLRDVGTNLYSYSREVQASIKNHRAEYLFWGTIATDQLLPYLLPFGPDWVKALAAMELQPPIDGKPIKIRLYRDSYSLVGYHVHGIKRLRQDLLTR